MKEANKKAAGIGDLYLQSKEGVTKMDEEVDEFKAKLRKKGEGVSEAKKALNEKCIEECSTGLYCSFDQIHTTVILEISKHSIEITIIIFAITVTNLNKN